MKNFRIESPCSENWNEMTSTQKGAFCQKCTTEVHDFTGKSNSEIRAVLLENSGKQVCGRYTIDQPQSLSADFDAWKFSSQRTMQRAMIFSLVVVFGLTLFSCNNKQDAQALSNIQTSLNEIEMVQPQKQIKPTNLNDIKSLEADLVIDQIIQEPELLREVREVRVCELQKEIDVVDVTAQRYYHTMGISIRSDIYEEYLLDVVEVEPDPLKEIELDENGLEFPVEFASKVYPNPAIEATSLEVKLPVDQDLVVINLFDMSGSHIQSIYEGELKRGTHTYGMNLIDLQPGVYLVTILSGEFKETVRISKS